MRLEDNTKNYIIPFPIAATGNQWGGWFKQKIKLENGGVVLDNGKNVNIRIPGLGSKIWDELGATVTFADSSDIFRQLTKGTINAAEWVGPGSIPLLQ
jgi:TRAP-type mannitol/chloroaromatic compound transport system substrate-binding protein